MKKTIKNSLLALAIVLLLSSCSMLLQQKGTLCIRTTSMTAKTLFPGVDMDIDTIEVTGDGPSSSSFSRTLEQDATIYIDDLLAGTWHLSANGYNAAHERIGSCDSVSAIVEGNATTTASMIIVPLSGNGTFSYTLTWPDEIHFTSPEATGQILTPDMEPTDIALTINGNTATYSSDLPAGYYAFFLTLKNNGEEVWTSNPGAFRIVAGATTSGSAELDGSEIRLYGTLDLEIGVDMKDPLEIELTGSTDTITDSEMIDISASIDQTPDEYSWYLDGGIATSASADSITLGPNLSVGTHCVSLLAVKGTVLGAEDYYFTVTPSGNRIAETFDDGLAQGWSLENGFWEIADGALHTDPSSTNAWKSAYYGTNTFNGAMEYRVTVDASEAIYTNYTKSIFIGSVNPVIDNICPGLTFGLAGAPGSYSYWIGKVNSLGTLDYWTNWLVWAGTDATVTMKIVADGEGNFSFYLNDDLAYSVTDTSIEEGYVGLAYFDGNSTGSGDNLATFDDAFLTPTESTSIRSMVSLFKAPQAVKPGADPTGHRR